MEGVSAARCVLQWSARDQCQHLDSIHFCLPPMDGTSKSGDTWSMRTLFHEVRWKRTVMRQGSDARKGRPPERHRRGTVLTPTPTFGPSVGTLLVAVVIGFVGTLLQGKPQEFCGPTRRTRRCSRKTQFAHKLLTRKTLRSRCLLKRPQVAVAMDVDVAPHQQTVSCASSAILAPLLLCIVFS